MYCSNFLVALTFCLSGTWTKSGPFVQSAVPPCRDDLCLYDDDGDKGGIEVSETPDARPNPSDDVTVNPASFEFQCPSAYRKVVRGGVEFCVPMSKEEIAQTKRKKRCPYGETLVDTESGELCVPVSKASSQVECRQGHIPVQLQDRVLCVVPDPNHLHFCPPAHLRVNVDGQLKCHPIIDVPTHSVVPPLKGKRKSRNPSNKRTFSKGKRKGGKRGKKKRVPSKKGKVTRKNVVSGLAKARGSELECEEGKVSAKATDGYVCVEPVYPAGVCPEGQIPMMDDKRITCVNCPRGERAVRTEGGVRCSPVSSKTTPRPSRQTCPEGLVPVDTAVGRVCRYVPPPEPQEEPSCPPGQQAVRENGQVGCKEEVVNCGPGQVVIETKSGEKVCGFANSNEGGQRIYCPNGLDRVGNKCVYQPKKPYNPCPQGQEQVETDFGISCVHGNLKNGNTKCTMGAVLTESPKGFICQKLDPSLLSVPPCGQGFLMAKVGHNVECITAYEADLVCTGDELLVKTSAGFMCKKPQTSLLPASMCTAGEVITRDKHGKSICISLGAATEKCGQGYRAVPDKHQRYVCRKARLDLQCPEGFVLKLTTAIPTCVSTLEPECLEPDGGNCKPTMVPELPPCESGYGAKVSPDGSTGCFLHIEGTDRSHVGNPNTKPCGGGGGTEDAVRSCDFDISVLLAGCNPDCANGGTCLEGVCVCPPGVTGSACHLDVDECQSPSRPSCEYRCVNTFGSFQCDCPDSHVLSSDGVTCAAKGCIPDCLNNGECRGGQCLCPRGFDGDHCQIDIDECQLTRGLCQHTCRNTYGGYQCICPPGSRLNADRRTCTNTTCIPECRNGGACENNRCLCPAGFQGIICQLDINECYKKQPCHHLCINTRGSYRCACNHGYTLDRDGHACRPVQDI